MEAEKNFYLPARQIRVMSPEEIIPKLLDVVEYLGSIHDSVKSLHIADKVDLVSVTSADQLRTMQIYLYERDFYKIGCVVVEQKICHRRF